MKPTENSNENDILERLSKVEVDILQQEYRITRVLFNIYKFGFNNTNEDKRNAVWLSLISYFLRQRTITIIISAVSSLGFIVTTYILINQNSLMERQNLLIEKQNRRLDQQTYLQEAERRSSLVFQLGNILDGIDKEIKADIGEKIVRDISPELSGRIISLSGLLKPYRYLENDSLIPFPLSPERGQLLISLLNSDIDINTLRSLYTSANFSYSDLTNSYLVHFDLNQARLMNSNFSGSYLLRNDLSGSNLSFSNFSNAIMQQSNLNGATLSKSILRKSDLSYSTFNKSDLEGSDLSDAILFQSKFDEANLKNVRLDSAKVDSKDWMTRITDKYVLETYTVENKIYTDDKIGKYYLILRK